MFWWWGVKLQQVYSGLLTSFGMFPGAEKERQWIYTMDWQWRHINSIVIRTVAAAVKCSTEVGSFYGCWIQPAGKYVDVYVVRLTSIVATTWTAYHGGATGGGGAPGGGAALSRVSSLRDERSRHKIITSSIAILLHV